MKCLPLFCAALALTFATTPGCKKQDKEDAAENKGRAAANPNEVVASVDGVEYLRKDMDKLLNSLMEANRVPENQRAQFREAYEPQVIDSFINKTLLLNEAKKEGLQVTDEERKAAVERADAILKDRNMTLEQHFKSSPHGEEAARDEFEKGILFEKLLQEKVMSHITVSDDDVAKFILDAQEKNAQATEANKAAEANKPAQRAKIEGIKKQLDAGADFAKLASENSDCPSKERGGSLGEFQRGQMVKPFDDAAFAQEVGKIGDIIETQFGYHVILVTDKQPAKAAAGNDPATPETVTASHILVKFDETQPVQPVPTPAEVSEYLKQQQSRTAIQHYLAELRAKATIKNTMPIE